MADLEEVISSATIHQLRSGFPVRKNSETQARLIELGREVGAVQKSVKSKAWNDFSFGLLPKEDSGLYYLVFSVRAIRANQIDPAVGPFLVELTFLERPDAPPPERFTERRKLNRTTEWLLPKLNDLVEAGKKSLVTVEATIGIQHVPWARLEQGTAMKLDGAELRQTGFEYSRPLAGEGIFAVRLNQFPLAEEDLMSLVYGYWTDRFDDGFLKAEQERSLSHLRTSLKEFQQ